MTAHAQPALALLRRLLRAHRTHCPDEMRAVGDAFVKSEFRQFQTTTDPLYLRPFFRQWHAYLAEIERMPRLVDAGRAVRGESGGGDTTSRPVVGRKLSAQEMDRFSDEQIMQLYALKQEILGDSLKESSGSAAMDHEKSVQNASGSAKNGSTRGRGK